jgi:hypothetical protein
MLNDPQAEPTARPVVERVRPGSILRVSRWWAAVAATVLVVVGTIGVAAAAVNASTASSVVAYVPADAVAYAEVRLDLPGDQHDQASRLLQHFPGLLDSAILDDKIGMALDRVLGSASADRYHYTTDVAPWVTGQAGLAVLAPTSAPSGRPFQPAFLVGVKDEAKAAAQLERFRADAVATGAGATSTLVNGATAWTLSGLQAGNSGASSVSYALAADMLIVTEQPDQIGSFLAARAGSVPNLASSQAFRDAVAHAPDARVGTLFVNGTALAARLKDVIPTGALGGLPFDPLSKIPSTVAGWLRLEGDRIVAEARASGVPDISARPVRESRLAGGIPADAIAYAELRDAGTGIRTLLTQALATPGFEDQLAQLRQVESLLGTNIESFFDWAGDLGVVVLRGSGGIPSMAIVAEATDRTTAASRIGLLRTLLAFGGEKLGLRVTDTRHGEASITTVDLSAVVARRADGKPTELAWTLVGNRFILGLGPDVVASVLDVPAGAALVDDARFRDLLSAAGGPATAGFVYVDVAAIRSLVESSALMPAERERYETDVRPYLEPVDRLMVASGRDGDASTTRLVITVGGSR